MLGAEAPRQLVELAVVRLPRHAVHRERQLVVLAVHGARPLGAPRRDGAQHGFLHRRPPAVLQRVIVSGAAERTRRGLEGGARPVADGADDEVVAAAIRACSLNK